MLAQLRIKNLAIVDDVRINFGKGLNIITGQTGAGKSILLSAIALVSGKKAQTDLIRKGEKSCVIEASFELNHPAVQNQLKNCDIDIEDDVLWIRRELNADGKNRCYINGQLVNTSVLRSIAERLVEIHSQHDTQSLFRPDTHRVLIDGMGGLNALCDQVRASFESYRVLVSQRDNLLAKQKDKASRLDWIEFQLNELKEAHLQDGEEEALLAEKNSLDHREDIHQLTAAFLAHVDHESGGVLETIGDMSKKLHGLAALDSRYSEISESFDVALACLGDASQVVQDLHGNLSFDPGRMEWINARIYLYQTLHKKYGKTTAELLSWISELEQEVHMLTHGEAHLEHLEEGINTAFGVFKKTSDVLSQERRKTSKKLDKRVTEIIRSLGMAKASFETRCESCAPGLDGCDRLEFMILSNIGEGYKCLKDTISGGEASRVLLALKKVLADVDHVPVSIFDEIDANVGGEIALCVGEQLRDVARKRQVICVTHLPQIACLGDVHLLVSKELSRDRTRVVIAPIQGEERVCEMARMLGGDRLTSVTKQHARELLESGVLT